MENFTSQEHKRDSAGNVVVDNPGKNIAKMREEQKNRNFINGIIISAMALTVVLTGTMLGATASHNKELKAQIGRLEMENQSFMTQRLDTNSMYNNTPVTTSLNNDNMHVRKIDGNDTTKRIWENRKNSPYYNRDYTSRTYVNRYYNPNTSKSDFISTEQNKPVMLPELSSSPVANITEPMNETNNDNSATNNGVYRHKVTNM